MKRAVRILFVSLTDNDLMSGPISGFARAGCECAVMSPPGFVCAQSRFVAHRFPLPRHRNLWLGLFGVRPGLERVMRDWPPDLVVPLDDASADLLRGLACNQSVSADLRQLLQQSLGAPAGYEAACSRAAFLELAGRIGVRAPKSKAARPETALEEAGTIGFPVVLKRENSCAGFGVTIVKEPGEMDAAIAATGFGSWLSRPNFLGFLRRGKETVRQLAARSVGALIEAKTDFEVQQFIPGASAVRVVAAWQGRVLAGMSFERLCVNRPPIGNVTVMQYIDHPEMAETAQRVVEALEYTGLALFDFIIEEGTRHAYAIELNARTTGIVHLGPRFGQDLCGVLVRQLGQPVASPEFAAAPDRRPIVLFPRELERDPDSPWLRPGSDVLHAVPWDDPPIFDIYYRRLLRRRPEHAAYFAQLLGVALPEPEPTQIDRLSRFLRRAISP